MEDESSVDPGAGNRAVMLKDGFHGGFGCTGIRHGRKIRARSGNQFTEDSRLPKRAGAVDGHHFEHTLWVEVGVGLKEGTDLVK